MKQSKSKLIKRAFQELKEEIGKNLISILKLAMEHIDSLVTALTAAGVANAPAACCNY